MFVNTQNPSAPPRDQQLPSIAEALSAPFDAREIKFKPKTIKNNRALAMAYIDARLIQDRLDSVLGVENWQDNYDVLPDGSVICRLKLKFGTRWITKTDVGSPSEQPDSGDRLKAAFSDALKRAAVKFGIGRYLYRIPAQWVDYDPVKKQFIQLPQLPASALPKTASPPPKKLPSPPSETPKAESPRSAINQNLPSNGQELHRRLQDYEAKLVAQKLCAQGALLAHVIQAGQKAGYAANMDDWLGPAIPFAVEIVKEYEQTRRISSRAESKTAA